MSAVLIFPLAGGVTGDPNTNLTHCAIVRGRDRVAWIDLRALLQNANLSLNLRLKADDLAVVPGVTDPAVDDHHLTCAVRGTVAPLLRVLDGAGVVELDSHELSLEEVFLGEFAAAPAVAEPAAGR